MPLYDFKCRACGGSFEELIRHRDATGEVVCEHCGSSDVERRISSFYAAATTGSPAKGPSSSPGDGFPRRGGCGAGSCGCQ